MYRWIDIGGGGAAGLVLLLCVCVWKLASEIAYTSNDERKRKFLLKITNAPTAVDAAAAAAPITAPFYNIPAVHFKGLFLCTYLICHYRQQQQQLPLLRLSMWKLMVGRGRSLALRFSPKVLVVLFLYKSIVAMIPSTSSSSV